MSNTFTHTSQPHPGYPGQPASYPQPGQHQQPPGGPRYQAFTPRGQTPPQNLHRPQTYYQMPPNAMMNPAQGGQVYTIQHPGSGQPGQISMQYHVFNQPQLYQHNGQRPAGPPASHMSNTAAPFQPGAQYGGHQNQVQVNPYGGQPHMAGHMGSNIIYSQGPGGPGVTMNMAPPHGHMGMYPPYRPPMPMSQPNMSQAPPQQAPMGGPQGVPPSHQQSQQQQQQQQQQHPPPMYQQQPPRPAVVSIAASSGPPPSTTPQPATTAVYQQPQQPQQPQATQNTSLSQPPPPSSQQPSNTLSRQRNRIKIVNPNTMEEVIVDNTTSKSSAATVPTSSSPAAASSTEDTAANSSTSSTPAPEAAGPGPETKAGSASKSSSGVATEFAARVAALAEGSVKKEDSPSSTKTQEEDSSPESVPEPVTVVKETEVSPEETKSSSPSVEADPEPVVASLSVTTDMKRDEPLYEPVSPTPLPDSPSDDNNKQVASGGAADTNNVVNNKFQEVINKKAAAGGVPADNESKDDTDAFEVAKNKKKKPSAAAKKAALNSKGEKKGDLLDVITSIQDPKQETENTPADINDVVDGLDKMSLNKPAEETVAVIQEDVATPASEDTVTHKVNGVNDSESRLGDNDSELEDGEILDTEEDENDQKIKLKYEYASDQWSPLNLEGKKQYGREFLICLQRDPLSLQKPMNLPNMEIVKDKPNLNKTAQRQFDFTPNFVKSNSRQGVNKRNSQGGDRKGRGDRVDGNKPRMVINLPSISAEVKLNKAENAWKPSVKDTKKDADPKETEVQELRRKSLAILNKLTPQKFDTLVEKFEGLPIDSFEKLSLCMELVFEKAVDEPSFSVAYAQMCLALGKKKVADENGQGVVNFRKLLIMRCQQEFEKDYMEGLDREKYVNDINEATNEDDKKRIKMEFEAMEMKLRKRSLGNIRFIGELYKLSMLTARIMHECVRKLLTSNPSDEEALECLCRLLTTVGQALDKETNDRLAKGPIQGLVDLGSYFKEMMKLVEQKKTSARVRFLMQDVIELRLNGWKKRREDAGPKTIDQIHKEVEKEQMEQKLQHMTSQMGPPPARRQDDRRMYDRQDDRRRSQKGGPPPGQQAGEDGWTNVPSRPARFQEKIDPSRLRQMASSRTDADTMSFGPPKGGPGTYGSWGRGSQSGKNSRQEQPAANQNRFSQLDQSEAGGNLHYEGRGSDSGRYPRGGRNSRDISQDTGRANALALVRDNINPRSQSVIGPHPTLSRENSGPGARSYSMVHANFTETLLKGPNDAKIEDIEKWTKPLIDEFLHNLDFEETIKEISEKFSNNTITMFLETVFNEVIERSDKARIQSGVLMSQLIQKKMATEEQFLDGLNVLLECAEDLLVDIPKFWDFLAQIISPVFSSNCVNMKILLTSADCLMSDELARKCAAGKYLAAVLHEMGKSGESRVVSLLQDSGLQWSHFLSPDTSVQQFLRDNKLEWTQQAPSNSQMTNERLASEISLLLKSNRDNDAVFEWIDSHCSDKLSSPIFIRILTTTVVESCIDGIGGPTNLLQLNTDQLKIRNLLLKKYLDAKCSLECQALLALQYLMHRLEHPNKLLHTIFEKLYDEDVISEEAFMNWENNDDPAEQEGKGVALKSCTQFLIYIRETEEDDGDGE